LRADAVALVALQGHVHGCAAVAVAHHDGRAGVGYGPGVAPLAQRCDDREQVTALARELVFKTGALPGDLVRRSLEQAGRGEFLEPGGGCGLVGKTRTLLGPAPPHRPEAPDSGTRPSNYSKV